MRNYYVFILILVLLGSCMVRKADLQQYGNYEIAIHNAIIDFSRTSSLYYKYDLFYVFYFMENDTLLVVSITYKDKKESFYAGEYGYFVPNRYYESKHKKLFLWDDDNFSKENPILEEKLRKLNMIGDVLIIILDEDHTYVKYSFNTKNLQEYKKTKHPRRYIIRSFRDKIHKMLNINMFKK